MSNLASRFNFKMKPGTFNHRLRSSIQRVRTRYDRNREEAFLEYVAKQLHKKLQRLPVRTVTATPLKVDCVWKNHLYVMGKVLADPEEESIRFGGDIIWMPVEKKFRGEINLKLPTETGTADLTKDPRWLEYDHHIKLYQHYLDMCLRSNLFFYGITGALLAFIYNHSRQGVKLIFALLLPIVMSLSIGIVYLYGAHRWREVTFTIRVLKNRIGIRRAPDVQILSLLLLFSGVLTIGVGVALAIALIAWRYIPN